MTRSLFSHLPHLSPFRSQALWKSLGALLLLLGLSTTLCWACMWDSDTIDDEVRGIPEKQLLLSNRWFRHSEAYYEDRIQRLEQKVDLSLEEHDDLAVAWERVGEYDKALKVLDLKFQKLQKEPNPDHLYRYHANRGTILAHSTRYQEGLKELESALAINPEAHFGREKYQVLALKYILAGQQNPELWQTANFLSYSRDPSTAPNLFHAIRPSFEVHHYSDEIPDQEQIQSTFEAVAGMLRFGGREGPELYRSLADLSLAQGDLNAAWYFYRIAIRKDHPAKEKLEDVIAAIEKHWSQADHSMPLTKQHFEKVMVNSKQWQRAFEEAELAALQDGQDLSDPVVLDRILAEVDLLVPALPLAPTPSPWEPYSKVPYLLTLFLAFGLIAHILRKRD